ncbi:MAG: site-specific integrase [Pseudodesulfovibrio sp.]|nr:site-specific integrase [Pseudodesulfovibrio sp.]
MPTDIQSTYPKTEEKFSLKTKDYDKALKLVREAAVEVDKRFEEHRRWLKQQTQPIRTELSQDEIRKVGEVYYAHLLQEDEDTRDSEFYDVEDHQDFERPRQTFEEYEELTDDLDTVDRKANARGKVLPFYMDEAEEVLSWSGIRLEKKSPSLKAVAKELQAVSINATKAIKERNTGEVVLTPATHALEPESLLPLLSHAKDKWYKLKKIEGTWRPKTEDMYRVRIAQFIEVVGDRPINKYSKVDGRRFRDIILKLPANWDKEKDLRGLSLERAASRADKLGIKPMSITNANKVVGLVFSLWKWISKYYDESLVNPLDIPKLKVKAHARTERDPFTVGELNTIFMSPTYIGCKSPSGWRYPGDTSLKGTGRYWVPLIALFTGMRLGEIIQLYTDDIREEAGVHYFDINEDGDDKKVKNFNSIRFIPVHQELIAMGFMEHVKQRMLEGEKRLFPDLNMGKDGYYSSPFSKYFRYFLEAVAVKHSKNAFHSFRHCFEDACRDSDIAYEQMDSLQGHSAGGMKDRYGRGYFLRKLSKAMQKLQYRDLDLSHLHL